VRESKRRRGIKSRNYYFNDEAAGGRGRFTASKGNGVTALRVVNSAPLGAFSRLEISPDTSFARGSSRNVFPSRKEGRGCLGWQQGRRVDTSGLCYVLGWDYPKQDMLF
jgi:hypothetical protein